MSRIHRPSTDHRSGLVCELGWTPTPARSQREWLEAAMPVHVDRARLHRCHLSLAAPLHHSRLTSLPVSFHQPRPPRTTHLWPRLHGTVNRVAEVLVGAFRMSMMFRPSRTGMRRRELGSALATVSNRQRRPVCEYRGVFGQPLTAYLPNPLLQLDSIPAADARSHAGTRSAVGR